jgi:hyperosmotically inducible periplasmic protein
MKLLASLALAVLFGATAAQSNTNNKTKGDNTKVNQRDRADTAKTADQQSMSGNETELTRSIREEIMKIDGLSAYGQNIKIITTDGKVTIKGPVRTEAEKANVLRVAKNKAGSATVVDEVTVVPETN